MVVHLLISLALAALQLGDATSNSQLSIPQIAAGTTAANETPTEEFQAPQAKNPATYDSVPAEPFANDTPEAGAPFGPPANPILTPEPSARPTPLSNAVPNISSVQGTGARDNPESIQIQFYIERPVVETHRTADGRVVQTKRITREARTVQINIDDDLKKHDLPPDGKRAAVLAITAARHTRLLDDLKAAKTPEEKKLCSEALKENYTEHYAIETWWREQKLANVEARLAELRAQVTQRQESEERYVAAAMTIAELWADGIGITPPAPSRQPTVVSNHNTFVPLPGPQGDTYTPRLNRERPTPVPALDSPQYFGDEPRSSRPTPNATPDSQPRFVPNADSPSLPPADSSATLR